MFPRATTSNCSVYDPAVGLLDGLRKRVEELRASGAPGLAEALVELAEVEPVFGHRAGLVRGLLEQAAAGLDAGAAELQARVLLRLAHVKMVEEKYDDADRALERGLLLLGAHDPRRVEAACLSGRIALRRGDRASGERIISGVVEWLSRPPTSPGEQRAMIAAALAAGELAAEQPDSEVRAEEIFREALAGLAPGPDERFLDAIYLFRQALAAIGLGQGQDSALHQLRELITLCKQVGAAGDEIHARIALAGVLTERGDLVGLEEAGRHLELARTRALEHDLEELHALTMIGQAGFLARRGKTQGALDICLAIARNAVARKDVGRYVGAAVLMSTIYELRGDFPTAYRALAEAQQGLQDKIGAQADKLFEPHLFGLADRMGRERFVAMIYDVRKADEVARTLPAEGSPRKNRRS